MGPKRSSRMIPDRTIRVRRPWLALTRAKNSSHAGQPTIRSRRPLTRAPFGPPFRLRLRLPLLRPLFRLRHLAHHRYQHRIPRNRRRSTRSSSDPTGQSKPITRPRLSPTARRAPGHRGRDDGRRAASVSARVRPSQAALVPNSLTVAPLRPSPAFSPLAAPLVVEDSDPKLDLQGFTRQRRHGQALTY